MGLNHSIGWAFRTLDGAGTFHGMGIQNTGWCWYIPWDRHYWCGHSRHKTAQSHTPRIHCNTRDSVMHHGQSLSVILMSICHWPTRPYCITSLLRIKAKYSKFPLSRLVSDDVCQSVKWVNQSVRQKVFFFNYFCLCVRTGLFLQTHAAAWPNWTLKHF